MVYDNGDLQSTAVCQDAAVSTLDALLTASSASGTTFTWDIITALPMVRWVVFQRQLPPVPV